MKKTINTVLLILILLIFTTPQIYAGNKNDKQDPLSSPTPYPTPTPQFTVTPSPTPTNFSYGWFVINEIGWAGTKASPDDQWIEIYNSTGPGPGGFDVYLRSESGNCGGWLSGDVTGYQILEIDDNAISDIPTDGILSGTLSPEGECLTLEFSDGTHLDTVDCSAGWFAGTTNGYHSMERINPEAWAIGGSDPTNWASNNPVIAHNGKDRDGNDINGTPKSWNSNCIEPSVTPVLTVSPTPTSIPTHTPIPTSSPSPAPTHIPNLYSSIESGDYDGNETTDIAIFRRATGLWAIKNISRCYYGKEGDIPVSANYEGQVSTEIAVYRDGIGLWAIRSITRYYFGRGGDMPIPRDYSGDGQPDIAIYRGGLWAIRGLSRVYYGTGNDLPIPGDYDGDGTTDIAILREGNGLWAIRNKSRTYFGRSGDIPVPGDYSGDGTWRVGIYRPATGLWAIRGVTWIYFGIGGDWPVPGDYRGDGDDLPGIFRPSTGLWAIRGFSRLYFGKDGDTPVTR